MARRKAQFADVKYSALNERNSEYTDSQFELRTNATIPWKTVIFAFILCCTGFSMLIAGFLIFGGFIDAMYEDRMWPLLTLGTLTFVPGIYHVRIAYYAFKGFPGYSYQDIPEFD